MKLKYLYPLLGMMLGAPISSALAQEAQSEAPEILTSDLLRRQTVESPVLVASFVIYDDDDIKEVYINGEAQYFELANTITLNKKFTFKKGKNIIKVRAIDSAGNQQEKVYLVAYGSDEASQDLAQQEAEEQAKAQKDAFFWKIVGGVQYNLDSNPSNDLGLPVDTGDIEISGQIDDDQQVDTQLSYNLLGLFGYGRWSGLIGYSSSSYSKEIFDSLKTDVLFMGGGYKPKSEESGIVANYLFLDINAGDNDLSQNHNLSFGYQFGSKDKEDGTTKHFLGAVYSHKEFSDSSLKAGSNAILKWEYTNLDHDSLDSFRNTLTFGTGKDGEEDSEYSQFTMDMDWKNKWDFGLTQGIGYGIHYKAFPNQPLSSEKIADAIGADHRIDLPLRFSFSLGWQFTPDWSLQYNYDYQVSVSTKNPSYKEVNGLQLQGGF